MGEMTVSELGRERYISLTTFKRDGTPVSTPVWVVGEGERLLVWTGADTWKVRRIRRDPHVRVTPSTATGTPHGVPVEGTAQIIEDTGRVQELLARKYGLVYRAIRALNALVRRVRRRPAERSVTLAITAR